MLEPGKRRYSLSILVLCPVGIASSWTRNGGMLAYTAGNYQLIGVDFGWENQKLQKIL
jgi:hypothetical protein